ncbi:MAG: hypothetical protein ACI9KN_001953 [Gammaproteobacteria bacterium]|jgi:hypothetical protein
MAAVDGKSVQRLLQRFEHEIVGVNQGNISEIAGDISEQDLLRIGTAISICRAKYLKLVLEMTRLENGDISTEMVDQVRVQRLQYEEAMLGFAALCHALERGYVAVKEAGDPTKSNAER